MISNLSQLKNAVREKKSFVILRHYIKPDYTGQIRRANLIQTNGFYSIEVDKPDSPVTLANNCKGAWIEFGKASDWTFKDGICKLTCNGKDIWEIRFLE